MYWQSSLIFSSSGLSNFPLCLSANNRLMFHFFGISFGLDLSDWYIYHCRLSITLNPWTSSFGLSIQLSSVSVALLFLSPFLNVFFGSSLFQSIWLVPVTFFFYTICASVASVPTCLIIINILFLTWQFELLALDAFWSQCICLSPRLRCRFHEIASICRRPFFLIVISPLPFSGTFLVWT